MTPRQLLQEVWGPGHADATHYMRPRGPQPRQSSEPDPARPRYVRNRSRGRHRLGEPGLSAPFTTGLRRLRTLLIVGLRRPGLSCSVWLGSASRPHAGRSLPGMFADGYGNVGSSLLRTRPRRLPRARPDAARVPLRRRLFWLTEKTTDGSVDVSRGWRLPRRSPATPSTRSPRSSPAGRGRSTTSSRLRSAQFFVPHYRRAFFPRSPSTRDVIAQSR